MNCKACKRQIDDDSIFCKFCGEKQIRERKKKTEIKVPPPRQLPSGSWFGRVMVDGQRVSVTEPTEAKYYAKAKALKAGLIAQEKAPDVLLLRDCIQDYLDSNSNILSPTTIRGYKTSFRNRFLRCLDWDVNEPHNWQMEVNREAREVSPKTVKNAWALVAASLKSKGVSPPLVNLPKKAKSHRPWLDYKEITIFLAAIKNQPCELGALLALHSLRLSEVLGLKMNKVDFETMRLTVSGSRVIVDGGALVFKSLNKTDASCREVPIIIPRLGELLKQLKHERKPDDFIINSREKRLGFDINKICESAGLPLVGVHGLRHSFASLAYHLNWTKKSTMEVGGWSNSLIVDEIYTHNSDLERDVKKMVRHFKKTEDAIS